MRAAKPDELKTRAIPLMTAKMSVTELTKWFPVPFESVNDPLAALEPSKGALVQLGGGALVVLDYGEETRRLTVRVDARLDPSACLRQLFREVPPLRARVSWLRPDAKLPRKPRRQNDLVAESLSRSGTRRSSAPMARVTIARSASRPLQATQSSSRSLNSRSSSTASRNKTSPSPSASSRSTSRKKG